MSNVLVFAAHQPLDLDVIARRFALDDANSAMQDAKGAPQARVQGQNQHNPQWRYLFESAYRTYTLEQSADG